MRHYTLPDFCFAQIYNMLSKLNLSLSYSALPAFFMSARSFFISSLSLSSALIASAMSLIAEWSQIIKYMLSFLLQKCLISSTPFLLGLSLTACVISQISSYVSVKYICSPIQLATHKIIKITANQTLFIHSCPFLSYTYCRHYQSSKALYPRCLSLLTKLKHLFRFR